MLHIRIFFDMYATRERHTVSHWLSNCSIINWRPLIAWDGWDRERRKPIFHALELTIAAWPRVQQWAILKFFKRASERDFQKRLKSGQAGTCDANVYLDKCPDGGHDVVNCARLELISALRFIVRVFTWDICSVDGSNNPCSNNTHGADTKNRWYKPKYKSSGSEILQ